MKSEQWPRDVKSGPVVIKVYRSAHKKTKSGWIHQFAFTGLDGIRQVKQFADPQKALDEALEKAQAIAGGRPEMAEFSRSDRDELIAVRKLAGNVKPTIALHEWARAREFAGDHVLEAAQQWARAHAIGKVSCLGQTLVDEFIASKQKAGYQAEQTYRRKLNRFVEMFGAREISTIKEAEFTALLVEIGDENSRNDIRARMVTAFKWGRDKGYLPRGVQLEVEMTERAKEKKTDIGIISAVTLGKLLREVHAKWPQDLAALVLAAFCGIRSDELHGKRHNRELRQKWEDVFPARGYVRVSAAKENTPSWRFVPLCPAAVAWLKLVKEKREDGYLCEALAMERVRRTGLSASLDLPENCFRHSYISYRIPVLNGDKPQVATDAGTSVAKIDKRYRRPVTKEEGLDWFGVMPGQPS